MNDVADLFAANVVFSSIGHSNGDFARYWTFKTISLDATMEIIVIIIIIIFSMRGLTFFKESFWCIIRIHSSCVFKEPPYIVYQ